MPHSWHFGARWPCLPTLKPRTSSVTAYFIVRQPDPSSFYRLQGSCWGVVTRVAQKKHLGPPAHLLAGTDRLHPLPAPDWRPAQLSWTPRAAAGRQQTLVKPHAAPRRLHEKLARERRARLLAAGGLPSQVSSATIQRPI